MLGYLYRYGRLRHPVSAGRLPRHRRRAARPQHRGRRRCSARSSSAALLFGTTHGLQLGSVIEPELASNLTYIIQGLIVLFVGADVLVLYVWNTPRRLLRRRAKAAASTAESPA